MLVCPVAQSVLEIVKTLLQRGQLCIKGRLLLPGALEALKRGTLLLEARMHWLQQDTDILQPLFKIANALGQHCLPRFLVPHGRVLQRLPAILDQFLDGEHLLFETRKINSQSAKSCFFFLTPAIHLIKLGPGYVKCRRQGSRRIAPLPLEMIDALGDRRLVPREVLMHLVQLRMERCLLLARGCFGMLHGDERATVAFAC
mmetsp:Transcript_93452/g.207920  ORF Transcript_93452/g.207920 Transcript_93452/m.207920 type:complete len:201 (-) Transcript_93452:1031-1633(-)